MNWGATAALSLILTFNVLAAGPPKSTECLTCHDEKGSGHRERYRSECGYRVMTPKPFHEASS